LYVGIGGGFIYLLAVIDGEIATISN
jgi:hypothetical protein